MWLAVFLLVRVVLRIVLPFVDQSTIYSSK